MLILQTCIINVVVVFTLVDNQLTFSDLWIKLLKKMY